MTPPKKPSGSSPKKGSGRRQLFTRVKTARGRKTASTRWLQRQLNDPYVSQAKADGWRSRAAYKLLEINEKHDLLTHGIRVVDLGAAPGGWTQVLCQYALSDKAEAKGHVVACDILEMKPMDGATILTMDFMSEDAPAQIVSAMQNQKADGVLSDMAPSFTGHAATDHLRTMALAEAAWVLAQDILQPEGFFITKIIQGSDEKAFVDLLKQHFAKVHYVKPPSSRSDSAEHFLVAVGYRG